ncbi:MAG: ion transporter [Methanoregula sp.]|nr:ion transporter [Methanoregula sp.]
MMTGLKKPDKKASIRQTVFDILKSPPSHDNPRGRAVSSALILLIFLNVIAAVLETDAALFQQYGHILDLFAGISVGVFTVEYILRVWCCTEDPRYRRSLTGRLRYMATPLALIDILVILPFLMLPFLGAFPRLFWMVRFSRIFWILKIGHYSQSLETFAHVLKAKKGEIFIAFFAMLVLLILASALMFLAENQAQPTKFSSVIATLWWGVETLATIGYGDMVPVTPLGKFIAGIVALLGIGLFALPAGILASGFVEALKKNEGEDKPGNTAATGATICPHCGKDIHKAPDQEEH